MKRTALPAFSVLLALTAVVMNGSVPGDSYVPADGKDRPNLDLARIALHFEPNLGQAEGDVQFLAAKRSPTSFGRR